MDGALCFPQSQGGMGVSQRRQLFVVVIVVVVVVIVVVVVVVVHDLEFIPS